MKVWVLNLDAELELAQAGSYQPSQRVLAALSRELPRARALLEAGDRLLERVAPQNEPATPGPGECWCPTVSALKRLTQAGASPPRAPGMAVLRAVNHRRFCLELGGGAPGATWVATDAELGQLLDRVRNQPWLCKRPYGFAGRGQRRLSGSPSADDRRWLRGALAKGGFLAEPRLALARELCLHGLIRRDGHFELGAPCEQHVDAHGAWLGTRRAGPDVVARCGVAIEASTARVARALFAAGYFGPFGVDAYEWLDASGQRHLNALSEVNARYTMGFAVGMRAATATV